MYDFVFLAPVLLGALRRMLTWCFIWQIPAVCWEGFRRRAIVEPDALALRLYIALACRLNLILRYLVYAKEWQCQHFAPYGTFQKMIQHLLSSGMVGSPVIGLPSPKLLARVFRDMMLFDARVLCDFRWNSDGARNVGRSGGALNCRPQWQFSNR